MRIFVYTLWQMPEISLVNLFYSYHTYRRTIMFNLSSILSVIPMGAVILVVLMTTAVLAYVGLALFLKWLASESVLVTTVQEGTVKAVMRGNSFSFFLMSFEGYHLNDPRYPALFDQRFAAWDVLYHGKGNLNGFSETSDKRYDKRPWLLKHLGLYWVGWPWANEVYVYQFEWNETRMDSKGKEEIFPRAEPTDHAFVSDFTYAIVTQGAETRDRLPTDELTLVTVAIRNPYRALFSGEDWMRRITAAINRHARSFVGNKDYQDLISSSKDGGDGSDKRETWIEFSAPIIDLNDRLPGDEDTRLPSGLKGRYGVEIRSADLQTVDLSGDGDGKIKMQEAATRVYVAGQEALATRLQGDADAYVIQVKGEKEAESIRARMEVLKTDEENGRLLVQCDAIAASAQGKGSTVVWAQNPFIGLAKSLSTVKGDEQS